jgi:hypothetical protein
MTRFAFAVVIVGLAAARGAAQPAPVAPPPLGAGAFPAPPIVIQVPVTKAPFAYYKSGGIFVGADGYYPFDTGPYLLGGFDGLARYSGTYVMVPSVPANGVAQSAMPSTPIVEPVPLDSAQSNGHRGRLFHRR